MMTNKQSDYDDAAPTTEDFSSIARRIDQRVRQYVGRLDDDLLDYLEYEEEIDTFQPIRRKDHTVSSRR